MKNAKLIAIFLFSSLILTGCGSKTLSCSKGKDIEAGKLSESQDITFNNNKIKTYKAKMTIELNDDYEPFADTLLDSLEESFKEYKDTDGVDYKASKADNNISISIEGDYSKMNNDIKESLGIAGNVSPDKIKTSLEKDGYTCK